MSGKMIPHFLDSILRFFDFIIIDECHRGGASDESNWRSIMQHFSSAVQLGLTATPKRTDILIPMLILENLSILIP